MPFVFFQIGPRRWHSFSCGLLKKLPWIQVMNRRHSGNFIPAFGGSSPSSHRKENAIFWGVFSIFQMFGVHLFVKFLVFFTTAPCCLLKTTRHLVVCQPTPPENGATDRETRGILSSFLISHGYSASNIDRWKKTTSQVAELFVYTWIFQMGKMSAFLYLFLQKFCTLGKI